MRFRGTAATSGCSPRSTVRHASTRPRQFLVRVGGDLLDIGEDRVKAISLLADADAAKVLGTIANPADVRALVDQVLRAPINQQVEPGRTGDRYFVAFELADGTRVRRALWPDTRELFTGIYLPESFVQTVLASRQ